MILWCDLCSVLVFQIQRDYGEIGVEVFLAGCQSKSVSIGQHAWAGLFSKPRLLEKYMIFRETKTRADMMLFIFWNI